MENLQNYNEKIKEKDKLSQAMKAESNKIWAKHAQKVEADANLKTLTNDQKLLIIDTLTEMDLEKKIAEIELKYPFLNH